MLPTAYSAKKGPLIQRKRGRLFTEIMSGPFYVFLLTPFLALPVCVTLTSLLSLSFSVLLLVSRYSTYAVCLRSRTTDAKAIRTRSEVTTKLQHDPVGRFTGQERE
jgi:hypothetical protein